MTQFCRVSYLMVRFLPMIVFCLMNGSFDNKTIIRLARMAERSGLTDTISTIQGIRT